MKSKVESMPVDDLCRRCKKKIADVDTYLCEDCYNELCDAIIDTLPNLSPEYDPHLTAEKRDKEINELGEGFGLSPEEIRDILGRMN